MLLGQLPRDAYGSVRPEYRFRVLDELSNPMRRFEIDERFATVLHFLEIPEAGGSFRWQEADEMETVGGKAGNRQGGDHRTGTGYGRDRQAGFPTSPYQPKSRIADTGGASVANQSAAFSRFNLVDDFFSKV